MNNESYIGSPRWRTNAARVREFAVAQGKCHLCSGEQPLEARHRDSDNLGDERDGDVVAADRNGTRIDRFLLQHTRARS